MAHVAKWKIGEVAELQSMLTDHPVVAVVGLDRIPAKQVQQIRRGLTGDSTLRMSRNRLINLAIDNSAEARKGIDGLKAFITGNTAILATDMNPFKLYRTIAAMETQAPAKAGDTVPEDVKLKKGDTPFKPGPIVGELQKAGVPAAIDSGKVIIKKNHTLLKAGDTVDAEVAAILMRLEITPMTVGIETRAVYEDGTVFTPDVLGVDIDAMRGQFATAGSQAMNLAMHIAYTTSQTVRPLLALAHSKAIALSVNTAYPTPETILQLLAKARADMLALASRVPDALDDEMRGTLSAAPTPKTPAASKEKKEDGATEEEEVDEEEAGAGLGALFG